MEFSSSFELHNVALCSETSVCMYACEEAFSSFPALQGLEMPVNAIRGLSVDGGQFLQLQVIMGVIEFIALSSFCRLLLNCNYITLHYKFLMWPK